MKILSALFTLIKVLPEILTLIKQLEARAEEREKKKLVKKDVAKIAKAFETGDAELLNKVFRNEAHK